MHPVVYLPPNPDAPLGECPLAAAGLPDWSAGALSLALPGTPPGAAPGGRLYAWKTPFPGSCDALEWLPQAIENSPPRYFVGIDPKALPTERELRRPARYRGSLVTAAGGHWLVPDIDFLPTSFSYRPDGSWGETPDPSVAGLHGRVQAIRRRIAAPGQAGVPTALLIDLSADALRANYRLTRELVGRLGLLGSSVTVNVKGEENRSDAFPVLFAAMGAARSTDGGEG